MTPKIVRLVFEEIVERDPQDEPVLIEGLAGAEPYRKRAGNCEKAHRRNERHEDRVIASGTGTPDRFMTHIDIGADPDWNGVRYAPRPEPPGKDHVLSLTPGCM